MNRRGFLRSATSLVALSACALPGNAAASYPQRPVRVLVGFPPNGPVDIAGRLISGWLSERHGQPFDVENKVGDSGNVATGEAVRAAKDGYTLLIFGPVNAINTSLFPHLDFDFGRDIAPIAGLYRVPLVIEANPKVPVANAADLLRYAAENPGKLKVGYAGKGTPQHIGIELLKWMARIDLTLVPFSGSAPALQALVAGDVDLMFDPLPSSIGLIRDGKVRALAVTGLDPIGALPDVLPMSRLVPGYEAGSWFAVGTPRGTPPDVVATLAASVAEGLKAPAICQRIEALGGTPLPLLTAQLETFVAAETERYRELIKVASISR